MFTKLGTIKLSDFWRGLIVAVLTTPVTIIYDTLIDGYLVFDWKKIVTVALAGGIGYLLKNVLTGANGNVLTNK